MKSLDPRALVNLLIHVSWQKDGVSHRETYYAEDFNLWRDPLPGTPLYHIHECQAGETRSFNILPGELVPVHSQDLIRQQPVFRLGRPQAVMGMKTGRYYPQGLVPDMTGVFRDTVTPMRCVDQNEATVTLDLNHPMAGIPMELTFEIISRYYDREERGGLCTDWMELILSGPGMQSRDNGKPTDFFSGDPFNRKDPVSDRIFYEKERLVHHIDTEAGKHLSALYGTLIKKGDRVLDLMASWESHIPEKLELKSLDGVGMNERELSMNKQLTGYRVQDLNNEAHLPFNDHVFDTVICSLSVEYLTDPVKIFREIARILKPGGLFAVTFSNRWFPGKAIGIWEQLHEYERMGLVSEYFHLSEKYESLHTFSLRGYPRPADDKYYPGYRLSDPLYAVSGRTRSL